MDWKRLLPGWRTVFFFSVMVMLVTGTLLFKSYTDVQSSTGNVKYSVSEGKKVAGERPSATLIATTEPGQLVMVNQEGVVEYVNTTYSQYNDIDPVPGTDSKYIYVAGQHYSANQCPSLEKKCTDIVIETVDIESWETRRIFTRRVAGKRAKVWHDFDLLTSDTVVVADIARDRLFELNTTSGMTEWSWNAKNYYPLSSGGSYPGDWTHINDVEVLPNGWYMASMRNQDQVIFVDRQTGVVENWTLGSEGEHGILYRQHNPDYIPEEQGGPAVLVADSHNNRVVEYQRRNSSWERTWKWRDERMAWVRDADRLPNGHTLIADTLGNRVFEVDREGDIVWKLRTGEVYEVERVGTGDESAGGPSAAKTGLEPVDRGSSGYSNVRESRLPAVEEVVLGSIPTRYVNAAKFVIPNWMNFFEVVLVMVWLGAAGLLVLAELYYRKGLRLRSPVTFLDEESG